MNIFDVLHSHSPVEKGQFSLSISFATSWLTLSGQFTKDGESLYAHYPEMNLVAGSQDQDETKAKIKAIMRLVNLIESRLLTFIDFGTNEGLFYKDVGQDTIEMFENYALKIAKDKNFKNSDMISVFTEKLSKIENNYFEYSRKYKTQVSDLNNIQQAHSEMEALASEQFTITVKKANILREEFELVAS